MRVFARLLLFHGSLPVPIVCVSLKLLLPIVCVSLKLLLGGVLLPLSGFLLPWEYMLVREAAAVALVARVELPEYLHNLDALVLHTSLS